VKCDLRVKRSFLNRKKEFEATWKHPDLEAEKKHLNRVRELEKKIAAEKQTELQSLQSIKKSKPTEEEKLHKLEAELQKKEKEKLEIERKLQRLRTEETAKSKRASELQAQESALLSEEQNVEKSLGDKEKHTTEDREREWKHREMQLVPPAAGNLVDVAKRLKDLEMEEKRALAKKNRLKKQFVMRNTNFNCVVKQSKKIWKFNKN